MMLKQLPEDFIVNEITTIKPEERGNYTYFWLTKKDYTTIKALQLLAAQLYIQLKHLGFAGNKDKHAVTTQLCSAFRISKARLERVNLTDIAISFYGYGSKPISLGDLEGNSFTITIRDLSPVDTARLVPHKDNFIMVNYFDEQRFSKNNVDIGRALVKKEFRAASNLIAAGTGDYNILVNSNLSAHPSDFIGALREVPKKILTLFINAYQSWLWNELAAEYIQSHTKEIISIQYSRGIFIFPRESLENIKIPLIGFGTKTRDDEINSHIENIVKRENMTLRDFIIRELPDLSSEGTERDLLIEVKDFTYEISDDELQEGKKKAALSFTLPKGSYATLVVKRIFQSE